MDFGNLLVHLFNREERDFYGLDHVWGDAKSL
ncbi:MAG: RsfS/YbeB/iojap family protein [Anaerotignum sp.]